MPGQALTGSVDELHAAVDALDANTVPESYYQKVLASPGAALGGHRVPACHLS
jgi:hypothetical protein